MPRVCPQQTAVASYYCNALAKQAEVAATNQQDRVAPTLSSLLSFSTLGLGGFDSFFFVPCSQVICFQVVGCLFSQVSCALLLSLPPVAHYVILFFEIFRRSTALQPHWKCNVRGNECAFYLCLVLRLHYSGVNEACFEIRAIDGKEDAGVRFFVSLSFCFMYIIYIVFFKQHVWETKLSIYNQFVQYYVYIIFHFSTPV